MRVTTDLTAGRGAAALRAIKLVHTAVWAFFAGAILALPLAAWLVAAGCADTR